MHAIHGTSSAASTFTLLMKSGNKIVIASVERGSDACFISAISLQSKAQCKIGTVPEV
jgi:hypothetical protein